MILAQQKGGDFSGKNKRFFSCNHSACLWYHCSEPVHETVDDPRLACPGVNGGTLLAGSHVPHTRLVPEVAHLGLVAPRRTILKISAVRSTPGAVSYLPCSYNRKVWSLECCPEMLGFWKYSLLRTRRHWVEFTSSTVSPARRWRATRPPSPWWCPGTARSPPCGGAWWTRLGGSRGRREPCWCWNASGSSAWSWGKLPGRPRGYCRHQPCCSDHPDSKNISFTTRSWRWKRLIRPCQFII